MATESPGRNNEVQFLIPTVVIQLGGGIQGAGGVTLSGGHRSEDPPRWRRREPAGKSQQACREPCGVPQSLTWLKMQIPGPGQDPLTASEGRPREPTTDTMPSRGSHGHEDVDNTERLGSNV